MKIIDEKGKLFGRVNIVDLLVIALVLAVGVFLGMKVLGRGAAGEGKLLRYTVLVEAVEPEVYENVRQCVPASLMASGDILDGRVIAVEQAPHTATASLKTTTGELLLPLDEDLLDLTFTIEVRVHNTVTSLVGTQEVRIGKKHIVKTVDFEFEEGIIISCDWPDGR